MPFSQRPDNDLFTETFVQEVRALILDRVSDKRLSDTQARSLCSLAAGKMLRTRFAARLFRGLPRERENRACPESLRGNRTCSYGKPAS